MKGEPDLIGQYTTRYKEALAEVTGVDMKLKRDNYRNGEVAR